MTGSYNLHLFGGNYIKYMVTIILLGMRTEKRGEVNRCA